MTATQPTQCPFCKSIVLVNIRWAIQNGRVFCNSCCKSFDIHVGEEEDEKVEQAVQEISAPVQIDETEDELTTLDLIDHDGYWY